MISADSTGVNNQQVIDDRQTCYHLVVFISAHISRPSVDNGLRCS